MAADAPRLLLPAPEGGAGAGAGAEYELVFPLARGWSAVVDVRDTSCRLSHLATGATAALPDLNAVRATPASRVVRLGYEYLYGGDDRAAVAAAAAARVSQSRRNFRLKRRFRAALAEEGNRQRRPSQWKLRMDPRWKKSLRPDLEWVPPQPWKQMIKIKYLYYYFFVETHLGFSDMIRFAAHVPAAAPAAASTDGMLVMMYHPLQGHTGLVFCRPGDAAWTKVDNPVVDELDGGDDDGDDGGGGRSSQSHFSFVDFAFFGGRMFALDKNGVTAVFDAATLEVLDLVDIPPETPNFSTRLFPYSADDDGDDGGDGELISCLHLVALPSKLILVRIKVRSSEPESFDVFELAGSPDDDDGMAWCKQVTGHGDGVIGGYDLFLDGHHATFAAAAGGRGARIYYVHDKHGVTSSTSAAYCYSMVEDKVECVYRPPEESDCEYSTRPSWFVP